MGMGRFLGVLFAFCIIVLLFISAAGPAAPTRDCELARGFFARALEIMDDAGGIKAAMEREKLYLKAIELCPDYAEAHNNLGDVYESLGRYADAIREYQKAIEVNRDLPAPYSGLGDVYFKSGNYSEAVRWYDLALRLDPKDDLTQNLRRQAEALRTGKAIPKTAIVEILGRSQMLTRGPGDAIKISFGADTVKGLIPFDYNKAEIRGDAKLQLKELGEALASPELVDYVFEIGGHTDTRGAEALNLELSLKRATAVKEYLVQHFQISEARLREKGYGKSRLIAAGDDEASHAMNRRVEVTRLGAIRSTATPGVKVIPSNGISVDVGFLYLDGKTGHRHQIDPEGRTVIQTGRDFYQIFFHPEQDCYVYLLQKDSIGKWYVLFPSKDSPYSHNPVQQGKEYWVPAFDKGFPGDQNKGEETIYFLASLWEVKDLEAAGPELSDAATPITKGFLTRGLSHIGKPQISEKQGSYAPDYAAMLSRFESDWALVKTISFSHE